MDELVRWISITSRYSKRYLDKKFLGLGINSSQYFYILEICKRPGILQDQLLPMLYVNPSNITRALAQLEKAGFIIKKPEKKDKRTCRIFPTEKAEKICPSIETILKGWYEIITIHCTDEVKEDLELNLHQIGKAAVSYFEDFDKDEEQ